MTEYNARSDVPSYSNATGIKNEPEDRWKSTLGQVRFLKNRTEDLDRKLLELQKLLGKMQVKLSVDTSNVYSAFGDLVWKSKDIAGEARIVAEDFRINVINLLKADGISAEVKVSELEKWEKSIEAKIDNAKLLPEQFTKLSTGLKNSTSHLRTSDKDKDKKEKDSSSANEAGLESPVDSTNDKPRPNGFISRVRANTRWKSTGPKSSDSSGQVPQVPVEHASSANVTSTPTGPIVQSVNQGAQRQVDNNQSRREGLPNTLKHILPGLGEAANITPLTDNSSSIQMNDDISSPFSQEPTDMKDSKGKGGTRDRMQAIFNKNTKLSNSVNDVEQAFKPVIRDMFALYEFYQQMRIGVLELRAAMANKTNLQGRLERLESQLRESAQVLEDYQKSV
ncbi:hypothetical protein QCA50_013562 [Cerrena zonata]|uniref:Uncharacterized protein n=1 Tax=Cerrena zonata TaxID=2478898 RepID=A0AAW0FWM4_9APHY